MFDSSRVDRPGPVAGLVLGRTDPTSLSDADLIAYTRAAERQAAHAQSVALRAVADLADRAEAAAARSHKTGCAARARKRGLDAPEPEELAARAAIDQVRQTLRLSALAASNRIDLARALTRGPLTSLGAALAGGEVTLAHARVALTHTEGRDPDLVRDMLARTLPRAARQTPGDFGKALARAEHALDPAGAADRIRGAVRDRTGVHHQVNPDSTGTLSLTASEPETEWAFTVLDTLARAELHGRGTVLADGDADVQGSEAVDSNGAAVKLQTRADVATDADRATGAVDNNGVAAKDASSSAGQLVDDPAVPPRPTTPVATEADRLVDNSGVLAKHSAGSGSERASLPRLRAQILLALLEKAAAEPTFPTTHGKRRIETQVVLTLDTLLGLRDDPALINGRSVPGPIARELADGTGTLRRLVTDPVQGHLLDFGAAFPVPRALAEFVIARDRTCRVPGCNLPAIFADLEHSVPREKKGKSSSEDLGSMCRSHHTLKTAGITDVQDSRADGSATYVTVLGERIPMPVRPVLEPPVGVAAR